MPLTIEQVNAQAAEIEARMQLPTSDPNHMTLVAGRSALFDLADQLDVSVPQGATAVFYSGTFRDFPGGTGSVHSGQIASRIG